MVIGMVEDPSAGRARHCVFTEKEPVYARLTTTTNSNREQKVLSRSFSPNDEVIVRVSRTAHSFAASAFVVSY
ncbi:hypothetical protein Y032_0393g616 [Ancylostoma ceylanicum]|uniref:Uncharacterized protein n=1 Tax=Ancylostoma ceylanicum TaxID=53326 RepID=A0A016RRU1_9BILA|nr:hypothetical protein Y032_0393g616 [Ancylostoma ceylanicum]